MLIHSSLELSVMILLRVYNTSQPSSPWLPALCEKGMLTFMGLEDIM